MYNWGISDRETTHALPEPCPACPVGSCCGCLAPMRAILHRRRRFCRHVGGVCSVHDINFCVPFRSRVSGGKVVMTTVSDEPTPDDQSRYPRGKSYPPHQMSACSCFRFPITCNLTAHKPIMSGRHDFHEKWIEQGVVMTTVF